MQDVQPRETEIPRRRFTVSEYYRMADAGLFVGQRIELIDGEVVKMSPQSPLHAGAVSRISDLLRPLLPSGTIGRVQMPLAVDDAFEPEPDFAAVKGSYEEFDERHPTTALLVLEVAVTSVAYDRDVKANVYARAGVDEYCLVDMASRTVEVYRSPRARRGARFGYEFSEVRRYVEDESIRPLFATDRELAVASFLPQH